MFPLLQLGPVALQVQSTVKPGFVAHFAENCHKSPHFPFPDDN